MVGIFVTMEATMTNQEATSGTSVRRYDGADGSNDD